MRRGYTNSKRHASDIVTINFSCCYYLPRLKLQLILMGPPTRQPLSLIHISTRPRLRQINVLRASDAFLSHKRVHFSHVSKQNREWQRVLAHGVACMLKKHPGICHLRIWFVAAGRKMVPGDHAAPVPFRLLKSKPTKQPRGPRVIAANSCAQLIGPTNPHNRCGVMCVQTCKWLLLESTRDCDCPKPQDLLLFALLSKWDNTWVCVCMFRDWNSPCHATWLQLQSQGLSITVMSQQSG